MPIVPPSSHPSPSVFRRLGAAGPVAIALSFWPPLGGFLLLTTLTTFAPWLREHPAPGLVLYFFATILLVGFSFLPTFAVALYAGWTFGFVLGFSIALAALIVASLIAYAIGRCIARDRVLEVIAEKPAWQAVHRALLGDSRRIIFVTTLLRIPPLSPFAIVNFVLAAARVPLWNYTLGTALGIAPRTAATAFIAAGLEQLQAKDLTDTPRWMLLSGMIAFVLMCIILGSLANRALRTMAAPAK